MEHIVYSTSRVYKATPENLDEIVAVTRAAFEQYQAELSEGSPLTPALTESASAVLNDIMSGRVIVAEEDERIVGVIRYEFLGKDIAYLYRFGVLENVSGSGIGTKLLDAAIRESLAHGASIVALHTNSKYYKLARYYYGKGFYVHSTDNSKGYIRALFIKELSLPAEKVNLTPAKER